MIKINKEKFNHFLKQKYPEVKTKTSDNAKGVVLFIPREEKERALSKIKYLSKEILGLDVVTIKYYKAKNYILVFYKGDYVMDHEFKIYYEKTVETIMKKQTGRTVYCNFANFRQTLIDSKITWDDIHPFAVRVIKGEEKISLKPMCRQARALINGELSKYTSIKYRTIGHMGCKRIIIFSKSDK